MQHSALSLVSVDVLVDALVAGRAVVLQGQASGNLFGTPLLDKEAFDLLPRLGRDARLGTKLLPHNSQLLHLSGTIASLPAIAAAFP